MATGLAIAGVAQAGYGIYQSIQAKQNIENYDQQKLVNYYQGYTPSFAPTQLQLENIQKGVSTSAEALQQAGARGLAMLPQVTGQAAQMSQGALAQYEQKVNEAQLLKIQEQSRLMGMQERRDEAQLAGYAQQYATGQAQMGAGIQGALSAGMTMGAPTATTQQPQTVGGGSSVTAANPFTQYTNTAYQPIATPNLGGL